MAKSMLRFNPMLYKDLKHLLFDILFTEKTFDEIQRDHRKVNGKSFFNNLKKFSFRVIKKSGSNKDMITNEDLDAIFERFLRQIGIKSFEEKKKTISQIKKT